MGQVAFGPIRINIRPALPPTEKRASPVAKAQPEADPPRAEMGLCLDEARKLER
jgi:hypothetical protein